MRRRITAVAAIIIASLVAWKAAAHEYAGKVRRVVDGDTLEVVLIFPSVFQRIRLDCIDTYESQGEEKSQEGLDQKALVEDLKLREVFVEITGDCAFGRVCGWVRPKGWDTTLNQWLYDRGAPLYDKLTRVERAECLRRLEE